MHAELYRPISPHTWNSSFFLHLLVLLPLQYSISSTVLDMIDETHFCYVVVVVVLLPLGVKLGGCWCDWLLLFPSRVLVVLCMPSVFCHGCVQHKKVVKCSSSLLSLSTLPPLSLFLSPLLFFYFFFYLSPFFSFSNFVWLVCRRSYLSLLGFLSLNSLSFPFMARDYYSPRKKVI